MSEIVAFFEIFILTTYAVYLVFRVANVITQKKPKEQEKQSLCDSCTHLMRKGCDIDAGKYKCELFCVGFHNPPEFCRNYERRKEKNKPPKETSNEQN